jgi:hypothetical protein
MDDRARVSLSVNEGKLEVEGSEAFVDKQLERLNDVMNALLAKAPKQSPKKSTSDNTADPGNLVGPAESYPNLFAVADDRIQILKTVPGDSTAEKTINLVLLYLLASELLSKQTASFEDLRAVCEAHGSLDKANFSSTIKEQKGYFLCAGSGKKQTASLTVPGRQRANAMARELNNNVE